MIFRNEAPCARVGRIVAIVTHHKVIVELECIRIGLLPVDVYFSALIFKTVVLIVFDATAKVAFMLTQDLEMFNKLKRQEVSFMLHIQPETLSRVLKKLLRNGTINIENGEVTITNKEDLISIFKGVGV